MLLGVISMAHMKLFMKLTKLHTTYTFLQVGMIRGIIMAFGALIDCNIQQLNLVAIPEHLTLQVFLRCFFGWLSQMFLTASIYMCPLSIAAVLYQSQPISASIANWLFNGESLSALQVISIGSAMLGVILLTYPSVLIPSIQNNVDLQDYPQYGLGVSLALTGSMTSGCAYATMRRIGTEVNPAVTVFYFGIFCVPASFFLSVYLGDVVSQALALGPLLLLFGVGFFGWAAQAGVSKAVSLETAAKVAPLNYIQVVIAWLFDVFLFGKLVKWTDILGTLLIIIFTFINSLNKGGFFGSQKTEEIEATSSPQINNQQITRPSSLLPEHLQKISK